MKENWTYKKLEDVCQIDYGTRVVQKRDGGSLYPVYGGGDATFRMDTYNRENCLVVARFAMSPKCTRRVNGKFFLNDSGLTLSAKAGLMQSYLDWHIIALNDIIYNTAKGAAQKNLDMKTFKCLQISCPDSLSEQQSIVRELDLLNDLIAKKRAQVAEYDQLQQSLFYTIFGDPVTNEKGWEVKKLGEVVIATTGITYSPDDVSDKGTVVLRSSNIQENLLDFSDVVRVNKEIKDKYIAKEGDILMCSRNGSFRLVGKTAKITGLQETMTWGAFMTIIRSDYNPYLLQYFRSPAFREQLTTAKTTTVNQITIGMLNAVSLPLPPLPLQQEFARKVEAIEALKEKVNASIKETETLFAARMDYYFG